jgi:hypothetical protein
MLAKLEKQRPLPVKKQRHSSWSEENVNRSTVVVVVVVVVIVARTSSSLPYLFLLLTLLLPCPSLLQRASRTTHADSPPAGQFPWGRRRRKGRREFIALFFFWLNLVSWDLQVYKMAKSMFFGGEPGGGGGF